MSADIILFVPRSNHKAERAFWKGQDPIEQMAVEIVNQIFPAQNCPPEYVAPEKDGA